jgi:hypothetical protein
LTGHLVFRGDAIELRLIEQTRQLNGDSGGSGFLGKRGCRGQQRAGEDD